MTTASAERHLGNEGSQRKKGLLSRVRGLTDAEWAERLARVSENQLTETRPPATYGCFRGRKATPLEWRRVRGVWRRYWPGGCEQPVSVPTGIHKCRGKAELEEAHDK